jgi:hypothetical protein
MDPTIACAGIVAGQRLTIGSEDRTTGRFARTTTNPDVARKLADPALCCLDALIVDYAIDQTGVAGDQPRYADADQGKRHAIGLNYLTEPVALERISNHLATLPFHSAVHET